MTTPTGRVLLYALTLVLAGACVSCTGSADPNLPGTGTASRTAQLPPAEPAEAPEGQWIAAWGAAPEGSAVAKANSSVRNIARVSVTGSQVRIRVANPRDSSTPLVIGSASVALPEETTGADVVPGTVKELTFGGQPGITVPAGTDAAYSDPIEFPAEADRNVAVTLHLPSGTNPDVGGAQWNTSYATPAGAGNQTLEETGEAFTHTLDATYALTAVDVLSTEADGAIVGLGSSTLHGANSTRDHHDRVLDLYITRNQDEVPAGTRKGIVGAGMSGDTLHAAVDRFDRDVLSQSGVSGVVVWVTNDLATRTADQVIDDYEIVIARSHAAGIRVYCPTWPPRAQSLGAWRERVKLNEWIRTSRRCDDTVDWDRTLRNDALPPTYKLGYFSDGIHPNRAGHAAMSEATPLRWFATHQ